MSSSDFDPSSSFTEEEEEDEEGKLYQWIYEMSYKDDKEEKEEVQSASRSEQKIEHTADDERSTHEARTSSGAVSENKMREWRPKLHSGTKRNPEPGNTRETPALRERTERKPWREPGADITDYFNYGFDEESWNSYRKKYTKLHTANAKSKVQKGHCTHEKREPGGASSYPSSTRAHSRRSNVFGAPSWLCREEEQVCHKTFSEEDDNITSYIPPSTALPPCVPFRRGSQLHRHHHRHRTSDSKSSEPPVDPSSSLNPSQSGVTSLIPKKRAHSAGVKKSDKAWENIQQDKCEDERGNYDRYKKRSKDRVRENASSACSRKKKQRHRKRTKPGQKQQRSLEESLRGGKEGREERRKRDKEDRWEKSSHSGSIRGRGEAGEVRDSQRSRRPKKKKGKNKNKEKKKTFTADQERKLQSE